MLEMIRFYLAAHGVDLYRDERGVTALEYGLIAAVMAVVIIAAFGLFGNKLEGAFNTIDANLANPSGAV